MTVELTEHRRPHALDGNSLAVREFLEKLCSQQYVICQWQAADPSDPSPGAYQPVQRTIDVWLEQFSSRQAAQPDART